MKLVRPNIEAMSGYTPGEQPRDAKYIKINTNESPYPPAPGVSAAVAEAVKGLQVYSDALSTPLRQKAAEVFGLELDQVIAGNGSDDILNILMRMCVAQGETAASFNPSYSLYKTLAEIQGANFRLIEFEEDYSIPKELDLSGINILFLPNPNAPSGTLVSHDEIRRLCRECAGVVVCDEAYADFAGVTAVGLLKEFDNLVVTRTFSKSYSLAGARLGLGFASPYLIENMMKVKDSYNLDAMTQAAGLAALSDQEYLQANMEKIRATRARLNEGLKGLGFFTYPSQANFILARTEKFEAKKLYEELKARKILVRYFDKPRLKDCLRISVGSDEETEALLKNLAEIIA